MARKVNIDSSDTLSTFQTKVNLKKGSIFQFCLLSNNWKVNSYHWHFEKQKIILFLWLSKLNSQLVSSRNLKKGPMFPFWGETSNLKVNTHHLGFEKKLPLRAFPTLFWTLRRRRGEFFLCDSNTRAFCAEGAEKKFFSKTRSRNAEIFCM